MPVRTSIEDIQPTRKLKRTIYHTSGNALFYEGETLTREDIERMKDAGIERVYELEDDDSLADFRERRASPKYDLMRLPVDAVIDRAGYSLEGEKLFPRGTRITLELLRGFSSRGIQTVKLRRTHRELCIDQYRSLKEYLDSKRSAWRFERDLQNVVPNRELAIPADRVRDGISSFTFDAIIDGHTDKIPEFVGETPALRDYAREVAPGTTRTGLEKQGFINICLSSVERLEEIYSQVRSGDEKINLNDMIEAAQDLARAYCYDRDLFALMPLLHPRGNTRNDDDALPENIDLMLQQVFNTAVWATILAAGCGFSGAQVVETAVSAFIHDLGMLKVEPSILKKTGKLTKIELEKIHRHSLFSVEMLRKAKHVPVIVPHIVFQVHERIDGSGYPLRLQDRRVHIMSRVAAIADAYAALNAGRPHRPALSAHEAMRRLLDIGAKKQLDDDLVRILAIGIGLFPVGSWVVLSTGARARVLGLDSDDLTRPVVAVLFDKNNRPVEPEVISLSGESDIAVTEDFIPDILSEEPFQGF